MLNIIHVKLSVFLSWCCWNLFPSPSESCFQGQLLLLLTAPKFLFLFCFVCVQREWIDWSGRLILVDCRASCRRCCRIFLLCILMTVLIIYILAHQFLTRSLWLLDEVMFGCSKAVKGWFLHSVSPAQTWCVQGQFWSPTRWRVSEINGEDCRRPCARRDLWMCNGAAALQMNPEASRGNSLIL